MEEKPEVPPHIAALPEDAQKNVLGAYRGAAKEAAEKAAAEAKEAAGEGGEGAETLPAPGGETEPPEPGTLPSEGEPPVPGTLPTEPEVEGGPESLPEPGEPSPEGRGARARSTAAPAKKK